MISAKKADDIVKGSVRILNLTLDFSTDNRIINVEIRKISEYFSSIELNPEILNNLEDAQLIFKTYRDGYVLYFILKSKQGEIERVPFNIPMREKLINV